MKKYVAFAVAVLGLAACDELTDHHSDGQTVMIDGREFFVRQPRKQEPNVYVATLNKTPNDALIRRDFALPAFNVRAIEAVSGCPVDKATIVNNSLGITFAAVNCG